MKSYLQLSKQVVRGLVLLLLMLVWNNRAVAQIYLPPIDLFGLGAGDYLILGNRAFGTGIMVAQEAPGPVILGEAFSTILGLPIEISLSGEPHKVFTFLPLGGDDYLIYNSAVGFLSWGRGDATGNHAGFYNNEPGDNETWTISSGLLGIGGWNLANKANTSRELKWNHSAGSFAAYTSGQHNIGLFKNVLSVLTHFAVPSIVNTGMDYVEGNGPSGVRTVNLIGVNLEVAEVALFRLPSNSPFEISSDGVTFTSGDLHLNLTLLAPSARVYVRLKADLPPGVYNDDLKILSLGLISLVDDVELTGVVTAAPSIEVSPESMTGFSYNLDDGGPSPAQVFTISGDGLDGSDIEIVGGENYFEFSLDGINYFTDLTLVDYDGSEISIYVRLVAGLPKGIYTDYIQISGGGIDDYVEIQLSGSVSEKSWVEHLVISQVYGGGGNAGAAYTHDFVELHNPTNNPINVNGWSIQYASTAGSTWNDRFNLPDVTIDPGQYYLIQLFSNGSNGDPLPAPDATGNINMAAANGKVALVSSTAALSGSCPDSDAIVDFVGYGTANCYEGAGAALAPSVSTSIRRKSNGRQDTDHNAEDFIVVTSDPRNSQSPINLPIDLLTFTATPKEDKVILDWTYANAEDFDKFVVEHTAEGREWSEIAIVSLLEEETSSRSVDAAASAVHDHPERGINYYRLKLVDLDGTYRYSKIVAANLSGVAGKISPVNTIVEQQIHLINTGAEGDITVRMTDMNGRILLQVTHRQVENTRELFIEAGQLPAGMVIMTITTTEGDQSYKMIKY